MKFCLMITESGSPLNRGRLVSLGKLGKASKMDKKKIFEKIVSLRYMIDNYREARMFWKVAELRLEIARLEGILRS